MSEQTEPTYTVAELTVRLTKFRAQLEDAIAGKSEEDLTRPGPEGWSVKDHLAHIAVWERSIFGILNGKTHPEGLGVDAETYAKGFDEVNKVLHERTKDTPLADVLADFRDARKESLRLYSVWSDADLLRPVSTFEPTRTPDRDGPIIWWISGNSFGHDEEHLPWIEAILGV